MVIVMKQGATDAQIDHAIEWVESVGYKTHPSQGVERTIIGAAGDDRGKAQIKSAQYLPGVEKVVPILKPYKLASRDYKAENTEFDMGNGVKVGGKKIVVMAGPCSVENYDMLLHLAKVVKKAGGTFLRGGAFKPRTSPYSFQGLGEEGLKYLRKAADETGLLVCTEVMDTRQVELVSQYSDMLQIGARNMQNFDLLKECGMTKKAVLLKRGLAATVKDLLMSAEYLLSKGNFKVMLCERGIRTFETSTRNTLDLNAIPVIKKETHLPVLVDPSHGTGYRDFVAPMAMAGVAAGCDGLMIEIHQCPEEAKSDGEQSLLPVQFEEMMKRARAVAQAVGRDI